jgi:hypothetical protein
MIGRPNIGQVDRPLTAEEIQRAAYHFLPESRIIDIQHNFKPQATVVESHITSEHFTFNNNNYKPGTWFLTVKVTDPKIIDAIKKGQLTGFSVSAFEEKQIPDLLRNTSHIAKSMFSDVGESEWLALTVSIVDVPFYPEMIFKIFTEQEFIKKQLKNKSEVYKMEEKEKNNPYELIKELVQQLITKNKKETENKEISNLKDKTVQIEKENEAMLKKLENIENTLKIINKTTEENNSNSKEDGGSTVRTSVIKHASSLIEDGKVETGEWDDSNATIDDYKELAAMIDNSKDPETKNAYSYLLGKNSKIYSKAVSSALSYANGARGNKNVPELVKALQPLSEQLQKDKEGTVEKSGDGDGVISKSLSVDKVDPELKSWYARLGRDSYGRKINQ